LVAAVMLEEDEEVEKEAEEPVSLSSLLPWRGRQQVSWKCW
jgi:hypothetical protein